ncbi:hypothetical protein F0562_024051 [Nyssa sinensis]|uniref:Ion transport domain-containing protein n=1 Tax=Nyssa sinensis TaxID=561372 RepID=A0A5J5BJK8_9ASTE|nr:hypothetical protein F0562_024051 [Nyssa sinensis]
MDAFEKDEVPMLSDSYSQVDERHTGPLKNERRTPLIQMSGPLYISCKNENFFRPTQGATGRNTTDVRVEKYPSFNGMGQSDWPDSYAGKNEHLLKSGQLGICNDPYCTTCPTYYNFKDQQKNSKSSVIFDPKFHNVLYGDAKDPLFFFLFSVNLENKCIVINWPMSTAIVVFRSMTDFIYLLNMLLQFRLAYISPESRVVGAGDLVDQPKKIALNYLKGYFLIDLFVVLPLPQIIILLVLPKSLQLSGANNAKNLLRAAILVQYIPRLYRFLPLLAGQSPTGFIFETGWANFVINLLTFVLSGHVVGSCWYLFGLQSFNFALSDYVVAFMISC